MSARAARTAAAALAAALAVTLSGCEFKGAASIPLPGGEGVGSDAYSFTVEFADVLDLVPQSAVKVNDVTVGSVGDIDLDGYTARVEVRLNGDVEVPANSTISLRQTSLLGEKFVSIAAPPDGEAEGRLRGGEIIGLDRTERSAEIEEVLGALSLVLNGGSLEQLQVINAELVDALEGREADVKSLLQQLDVFVGGLDAQKGQIVRALDSLDRLSARLVRERDTIAVALDDIPAGVEVLTEQREDLTRVLTGLDRLGDVAVRVIEASRQNTRANLQALEPILTQLNAAGRDLPEALELLTTYPFPRTVTEGIKGDYANLFVTADLDLRQIAEAEGVPVPSAVPTSVPVPTIVPLPTRIPQPPSLPQPAPQPVPTLTPPPGLPVPTAIPTSLPGATRDGTGTVAPRNGPQLPTLPGIGGLNSLAEPTGLLRLLLGGLS